MKKNLAKWSLRFSVTTSLIGFLLVAIVLRPDFSYAYSEKLDNFTLFHQKNLDKSVYSILEDVKVILQSSELYNPESHFDICLNDGSVYPSVIRIMRGTAFAWGFYDKVVLQGELNCRENTVELNGYKWNLTQLLAHEITHCMQFNHYGFWKSNPVARIPEWKWEGYAEYIARNQKGIESLISNLNRLIISNKVDSVSWEIVLSDNTISPRTYYDYFLLTQYCMEVKKWSFDNLLNCQISERDLRNEMMFWYFNERNRSQNNK